MFPKNLKTSIPKISIHPSLSHIHPDSNEDLALIQLDKELEDISSELEDSYWDHSAKEVAVVIAGYIAKKMTKKTQCRAILTFNSERESAFENFDYFLRLSRGGLTLPAVDLTHYVSKSFAMLELSQNIFRKIDVPERVAAEHVLRSNDLSQSFLCDNHSENIKFVNRIICNIFFNNAQKLVNSQVRRDAVEEFKRRQRKRRRT